MTLVPWLRNDEECRIDQPVLSMRIPRTSIIEDLEAGTKEATGGKSGTTPIVSKRFAPASVSPGDDGRTLQPDGIQTKLQGTDSSRLSFVMGHGHQNANSLNAAAL